ncbi:MAG: NAD(P)H-hydrate epimerase [Elusimicrobia bacterium]|nr:NAD(P)H-hydrate epimerase [Elusimicrobiota bacterium]
MCRNTKRCKIVSSSVIRNFDRIAVDKFLIPSVILMENAGKNTADIILKKYRPKNAAIFSGGGNNGGDGFVIARHLFNNNVKVKVFTMQNKNKYSGDALVNLNILQRMKIPVINSNSIRFDTLAKTNLIVDALLGTGTKGKIRESYKNVIDKINSLGKPVVSVDIPSGIDADTGLNLGSAVKASTTVTMAAIKKGLTVKDGKKYSGKIFVVDIGITANTRK